MDQVEEFKVKGDELLGRIKELIAEGNVRRLTIKNSDGKTMIEIAGGSVQPLDGSEADRLRRLTLPADEAVGRVTLMGEIVDSKCFWGVMKPGNLKPHRACAVRCISGGIPPLFLVRDEDGETRQFLLVGAAGEPVNDRILDRIAEPLEITGRLTRRGDLLILSADPDTYRRR